MAGYGTSLTIRSWADQLVRKLLRVSQGWAKSLDLEMHYRSHGAGDLDTRWEIWVDGNSFAISAWSRQIERDLPKVAQGFGGGISSNRAAIIAESLCTRWIAACVGNEDDARIRTSANDQGRWIWPIVDYPVGTPNTARLIMADEVLAHWLVAEAPAELVVEELHTVVEALLRFRLGAGRSVRWPQLLERAESEDLLSARDVETLTRFNRGLRIELKHTGSVLSEKDRPAAEDLLWRVLSITENQLGDQSVSSTAAENPQP